jgi:hypothetical protein
MFNYVNIFKLFIVNTSFLVRIIYEDKLQVKLCVWYVGNDTNLYEFYEHI